MSEFDFSSLARVNTAATSLSATIRQQADYFQVDEVLPFEPDGSGGHVWLKIQKRDSNTDWVAGQLAKFAGVAPVAVGYAGLKDRHAVTTQWFSINMEGHEELNWQDFANDEISIVEQTRHSKKLKRGVLAGNTFTLRLTELSADTALWQDHLAAVKQHGVPNYFAEQRFGHHGNNLNRAEHWFSTGKAPKKRNQKSLYLSAARSWLFNQVVSKRVDMDCWQKAIDGDVMLLAGTQASLFTIDSIDDEIKSRIEINDIHPTGPLWGKGEALSKQDCLQLENDVLADWADWQVGLEKMGLKQQRRALRLIPENFDWHFIDDQQLELRFFLPSGSYATAVLRELAVISDAGFNKLNT